MSKEPKPLSLESIELSKVKQPYYDIELGKICRWLKEHGLTMHVTLSGEVTFRDKITREIVKL